MTLQATISFDLDSETIQDDSYEKLYEALEKAGLCRIIEGETGFSPLPASTVFGEYNTSDKLGLRRSLVNAFVEAAQSLNIKGNLFIVISEKGNAWEICEF